MPSLLADQLRSARQHLFVGRDAEKDLFQTALSAADPSFYILYFFGPGGVGKTTLLRHYRYLAEQAGHHVLFLDARTIDPSPEAFLAGLSQALAIQPSESPISALISGERLVLLIDSYDHLRPLEPWLRDVFFPQLPASSLIVLADRHSPSPGWRADLGWQQLVRPWSLRNLKPEEARILLGRRGIPESEHDKILDFTYGHPLALSLVADVFDQRSTTQFEADMVPNVVGSLLDQLVQELPGPAHRVALEACALVRLTSEASLAAMLEMNDVHELFEWLRGLSFVDSGRTGLYPHDLAREALVADLRWRNPDWYAELHRRARSYYSRRIGQTQEADQRRVLLDFVYLHRHNAVVRPYFEWNESDAVWTDRLHQADLEPLRAMTRRHEGPESAQLADHWFTHQPEATRIFRDAQRQPIGFMMFISLHEATTGVLAVDPATAAAWNHLQGTVPLRPGEKATIFRYWMDGETYQAVSPTQSRVFINCVQHYLTTPGLAYTFFPCANPEFWSEIFAYADLARLPAADFTVGDRRYGVYGHDWRSMPPAVWLDLLAKREVATDYRAVPPDPEGAPMVVLSQPAFAEAIRQALRTYSHDVELTRNPLLESGLVVTRAGSEATPVGRAAILQTLLKEAIESLQASPRLLKYYRALVHTYLLPAPTQEAAAELLDLPFSTYRRHLKTGVEQVTEILWRKEIGYKSAGPPGRDRK